MGSGTGYTNVNQALQAVGLPSLDQITGKGPGFEEKLIPDLASFSRAVREMPPTPETISLTALPGSTAHPCPAEIADLWLPFAFSGSSLFLLSPASTTTNS